MNTRYVLSFLFLMISFVSAQNDWRQDVLPYGENLRAGVWVPKSPKPATMRYGVAVWLHGGMQSGRCDKGMEAGQALLPYLKGRSWLVVSPSACGENHWLHPQFPQELEALLNLVIQKWDVDTTRMEIVGVSDGALGAVHYALKGQKKIARYVLLSGSPGFVVPLERVQEFINRSRVRQAQWVLINGGLDPRSKSARIREWGSLFAHRMPENHAQFYWEAQGEHDLSWWQKHRSELLNKVLGQTPWTRDLVSVSSHPPPISPFLFKKE